MLKLVHIHFVFVVINLAALGYADDYMKREFSLVKPYQGKLRHVRVCTIKNQFLMTNFSREIEFSSRES